MVVDWLAGRSLPVFRRRSVAASCPDAQEARYRGQAPSHPSVVSGWSPMRLGEI